MLEIDPKVNAWFVRSPGGKLEARWRELGAVSLGVLAWEEVEFLVKRLGEDLGSWSRVLFKHYAEKLYGDRRRAGRVLSLVGRFSGSEKLHEMPIKKGDVVITVNPRGRFRVGEVLDERAEIVPRPRIRGQFLWRRVKWEIVDSFTLEEISDGRESLRKKFKASGPIVRASEFLLTPLAERLFPKQAREYRKSVHPTVEEVLDYLGFNGIKPIIRLEGEVFDYIYFRHGDRLFAVLVDFSEHYWVLVEKKSFKGPGKVIKKEYYYKPDIEELLNKENLTIDDLLEFY